MKSNYVSPNAEIKRFVTEEVITSSGTSTLTAKASIVFTNADANAKWSDKVK